MAFLTKSMMENMNTKWKTGTGSSFQCYFGEKWISGLRWAM